MVNDSNNEDNDDNKSQSSIFGQYDSAEYVNGSAEYVNGSAENYNEDFIDQRIEIIEKTLLSDYLKNFNEFIHIILNYTKKNGLIISKTDNIFNIYSKNSLLDSTNIANLFVTKSKFIKVITKVPYIIFDIQVNFNNFCRVTKILDYRGYSYYSLYGDIQNSAKTIYGISYLKDQIYISPIVEMIKIYSELYSFTKENEWPQLKKHEFELFKYYQPNATNTKTIFGGANKPNHKIQSEIFNLLTNIDCVVVGNHAVAHLVKNYEMNFSSKIQLIANDIEPIVKLFKTKNINVNIKNDKFAFPFELRLTITTLEFDGIIFMEIFNCSKYDIIMCKKINNAKIAHPYIICKFLFVELFKFQMLLHSSRIPKEVYNKKKIEIIKLVNDIRNIEFDKIDIFGMYHDEELAIKEEINNANMYHPYEPYKYFLTFQRYREIK